MKFTMKLTNAVEPANWTRVKLTHLPNDTTNHMIGADVFNRECKEYDAGALVVHRDLYLGERT